MVKFEGKIGTLYQIFTPCTHCKFCMMFKRKGGGVKGLLNNVQKNCTFLKEWLPLVRRRTYLSSGINLMGVQGLQGQKGLLA